MLTKKLLILQLDVDVSPYDEGYKLNFSGIKHLAVIFENHSIDKKFSVILKPRTTREQWYNFWACKPTGTLRVDFRILEIFWIFFVNFLFCALSLFFSGGGGWVERPFYAFFKNSCYINCSFVHLLKVDFYQSEKDYFILGKLKMLNLQLLRMIHSRQISQNLQCLGHEAFASSQSSRSGCVAKKKIYIFILKTFYFLNCKRVPL